MFRLARLPGKGAALLCALMIFVHFLHGHDHSGVDLENAR
jgi:hypothetical protein